MKSVALDSTILEWWPTDLNTKIEAEFNDRAVFWHKILAYLYVFDIKHIYVKFQER